MTEGDPHGEPNATDTDLKRPGPGRVGPFALKGAYWNRSRSKLRVTRISPSSSSFFFWLSRAPR